MGGVVPVINVDGIKPGELDARRPDARQDLPRRDQDLERPGDQEAQSRASSCRRRRSRRAPFGRIRHHVPVHRLSVEGERRLEGQGRRQHRGEWPVGIGAKGNEGVANNVAQTKGSIGYVEYAYAKQNKLTYTKMVNKDGKAVAPTAEAFRPPPPTPTGKARPASASFSTNQAGADVLADRPARPSS